MKFESGKIEIKHGVVGGTNGGDTAGDILKGNQVGYQVPCSIVFNTAKIDLIRFSVRPSETDSDTLRFSNFGKILENFRN